MKSVIDELSLKINVKVKKDIDKTIRSIASAINRLNKVVANVSNLQNYVRELNKLSKAMTRVSSAGAKSNNSKRTEGVEPEVKKIEVQAQEEEKKRKEELKQQKELAKREKEDLKRQEKARKQSIKNRKEAFKSVKKSFSGLFKGLRRVASIGVYRAIRFALSQIVKSVVEGLSNLREYDSELDMTLKRTSQAVTSLRNSFASLFAPLITELEPIITKLADKLANIANRQAEARAALKGQTTYSKILTSDSEEYKNNLEEAAGTLLEFDKFSSLDKDNEYSGVVSAEVTMSKEDAEQEIENYNNIIDKIKELVKVAGAILGVSFVAKLIKPITLAFKGLGKSIELIGKLGTKVFSKNGGLLTMGIASLATGVVALIYNWKDMSSTAKALVPIISGLAGVVAALATALYFTKGNIAAAIGVGATVTGVGLTVGSTLSAQKYADGGVPPTGTLFYAGEAGAEIVANTSGGKTGVTNIAQFKTAMVQALAEYGVAKRGTTSDTVLQINGKEFARATATDVASALGQKYRVDFQPR